MPRLGNERQEIYCKHRAKGLPPAKAATVAGYATGSGITTTLEAEPEIISRIRELMDEAETDRQTKRAAAIASAKVVGAMTGVSRAWVLERLAENAQLAANDGEYKDSNSALELIGKELGMFQGASKGEGEEQNTPPIGLDQMTSILDEAEASRPAIPALEGSEAAYTPSQEEVLDMLGGSLKGKVNLADARQLTTGSETDIALHEDFGDLPDDEETPEA